MRLRNDKPPINPLRLRKRWQPGRPPESAWSASRPPVTNPQEIVRSNYEHDRRAGLYDVQVSRWRWWKRRIQFITLGVAGNGLGVGFIQWVNGSLATTLVAVGGMVFYTVALAWLMFVHFDES